MKRTILFLLIAVAAVFSGAATPQRRAEIAKLRLRLADTSSQEDSIKLLYDILDLSPRADHLRVGRELDGVARRAKKPAVRYDVARLMVNVCKDDSDLAALEKHVGTLPPGKEQKETELFVKIRRIALKAKKASEEERRKVVTEAMADENSDKLDQYQKIVRLYTICEYLGTYLRGDMLVEYLDDLSKLMEESDIESYALYNTFYTESANIYSATDNPRKALAADRELLRIIDRLEKKYEAEGRKYRNYDVSRYVVYRRMLSNYKALPLTEVNDYYSRILEICGRDEDVMADFRSKPRTAAYHAIKHKRYAEAVPYIKRQLECENTESIRRKMLEMLIEASISLGDKDMLAGAKAEYDSIMQENEKLATTSRYNELKIRYDVGELKAANSRLELANKNEQISSSRRMMTMVMVGWVLFGIILVVALVYWSRYRKMCADLETFTGSLTEERDRLKKLRYQDYAVEQPSGTWLSGAAKNPRGTNLPDTVNFILNDILYIASLGQDDNSKFRHHHSVERIMRGCAEAVESHVQGGVSFRVSYPQEDFRINVDKECLVYLINHILKVAREMTPAGGEFSFSCTEEKALKRARFVFTHTGDSLPKGKEEMIYDKFVDYRELAEHGDAAISICRMIYFLLSCTLRADSNYTEGGKLVLLVPIQ